MILHPLIAGVLTFGPGRDQYYQNVSLLLHGEGTNGSTTIVDSSVSPKTVTATGSTISTALQKFGSASILGGAGNFFTASIGSGGNMTGDFTWESFIYGGGNNCVFYSGTSTDGWFLYNDQLTQRVASVNTNILGIDTTVSLAWHHLAISRTGSTLKGFTDGVEIGSVTNSATIDLQTIICGKYVPNNNLHFTGNYDDMRVTKGVGRYTAAFTPPTRQFPNS